VAECRPLVGPHVCSGLHWYGLDAMAAWQNATCKAWQRPTQCNRQTDIYTPLFFFSLKLAHSNSSNNLLHYIRSSQQLICNAFDHFHIQCHCGIGNPARRCQGLGQPSIQLSLPVPSAHRPRQEAVEVSIAAEHTGPRLSILTAFKAIYFPRWSTDRLL
jgi:hypothetical protein